MHANAIAAAGTAIVLLVVGCIQPQEPSAMEQAARAAQGHRKRDYTIAWWPNGFRKEKADGSADVFCIGTGHYGFAFDTAHISRARLGRTDGLGYLAASRTGSRALAGLLSAQGITNFFNHSRLLGRINLHCRLDGTGRNTMFLSNAQ